MTTLIVYELIETFYWGKELLAISTNVNERFYYWNLEGGRKS